MQRTTSQVCPGSPAARITTLSVAGQSRGRLRASSFAPVAVPTPGISSKASHSGSTVATSASEAAHRSTSPGIVASMAETGPDWLPSSWRTASGRHAMSSSETASRSSAVTASGRILAEGAEAHAREALGRIEIRRHRRAQARHGQGLPEPPGRMPDGVPSP